MTLRGKSPSERHEDHLRRMAPGTLQGTSRVGAPGQGKRGQGNPVSQPPAGQDHDHDGRYATTRSSALDLYVDPNGSDSGTGSSTDPFATIQHAVDVGREEMPRANTVIHIADGLYNEDVDINHLVSGGNFNLIGNTTTPTNVELGNLLVRNTRALNVRASGVTFTKDRTDTPYDYIYGVIALNSSLVQISDCAFTAGPTRGIDAEDSLLYSINNDFGSGNLERANVANKGGRIISRSNTGNCTINGNWATVGGTVAKYDTTQPTGDGADDYHNAGGTIVEPETFTFDNDAFVMDDAGGYLRLRGTTEGRHLQGGYDSADAEHFRLEWDQGTGLVDLRSFDSPSGATLIARVDSPNDRIRLMAPTTRVDKLLEIGGTPASSDTDLGIVAGAAQVEMVNTDLAAGSSGRRWAFGIGSSSGDFVFLRDADDDGVFDSPVPMLRIAKSGATYVDALVSDDNILVNNGHIQVTDAGGSHYVEAPDLFANDGIVVNNETDKTGHVQVWGGLDVSGTKNARIADPDQPDMSYRFAADEAPHAGRLTFDYHVTIHDQSATVELPEYVPRICRDPWARTPHPQGHPGTGAYAQVRDDWTVEITGPPGDYVIEVVCYRDDLGVNDWQHVVSEAA